MTPISIAMATYNGGAFLRAQLDSLEAQTVKPAELVVCDDRSSDATVDVVRAFAKTASFPVTVEVNAERLGWRGNFVKAAGLCTAPLIGFCDQDDVWYPDKLATVGAHFADPDVVLVHHNADLIDADGRPYGTLLPVDDALRRIAPLSRPTHWSNPLGLTMTFRSALARYGDLWTGSQDLAVPGQPAAHDQWFYFLAASVGTVVTEPARLLGYRQHQGNSVGWTASTAARSTRASIAADLDRIVGMLRPFCDLLDRAASRDDPLAPAFRRAVAKNRALVARLERRRVLYRDASLPSRATALVSLVAHDDYAQSRDWGLGRRAFLDDVRLGLVGR